jgi:hypothetical protein
LFYPCTGHNWRLHLQTAKHPVERVVCSGLAPREPSMAFPGQHSPLHSPAFTSNTAYLKIRHSGESPERCLCRHGQDASSRFAQGVL